mmetsp:Transcript_62408/g.172926  ORF Transcript_62408/g.172926 Transcript_62408/m.172926 type:complete len:201 (-) Transcript_62408:118-720(-)
MSGSADQGGWKAKVRERAMLEREREMARAASARAAKEDAAQGDRNGSGDIAGIIIVGSSESRSSSSSSSRKRKGKNRKRRRRRSSSSSSSSSRSRKHRRKAGRAGADDTAAAARAALKRAAAVAPIAQAPTSKNMGVAPVPYWLAKPNKAGADFVTGGQLAPPAPSGGVPGGDPLSAGVCYDYIKGQCSRENCRFQHTKQ